MQVYLLYKNQEFKITDVYSEEKIENQLKKFIYKNHNEFKNFFDTLSENRNEIVVIPASVVHYKIIELINKCSYFKRKILLNIYFGRRQTFFNNLSRKMQKWNFGFEETREGGNLLLCKRNFFNTDYFAENSFLCLTKSRFMIRIALYFLFTHSLDLGRLQ